MTRVMGFFGVVLMLLAGTLVYARREEPEQWIAFISDRDGNAEIYRMRPDGSDVQQLTHTANDVVHCWIKWPPNSGWLFFARSELNVSLGGHYNCNYTHYKPDQFAIRPIGTHHHAIGDYYPDSIGPRWFITNILEHEEGQAIENIYWVSWDGRKKHLISDGRIPRLSPDGQWVAFEKYGKDAPLLFIAHPDGSDIRQLDLAGIFLGISDTFAWKVDSQWIVFGSSESDFGAATSFHQINVDSGEIQHIADVVGFLDTNSNLSWSPNGIWLVYWNQPTQALRVIRVGNKTAYEISEGYSPEYTGVQFGWSPDSQWIVFSKMDEAGRSKIWRIHPDGTGLEQLTFGPGEDLRPAWSPVVDKAWDGWGLMGIGGIMWGIGYGKRIIGR